MNRNNLRIRWLRGMPTTVGLVMVLSVLAPIPAQGVECIWDNSVTGGSWTDNGNWTPYAPGATDRGAWEADNGTTLNIVVSVTGANTAERIDMDWTGATYTAAKLNVGLAGSGGSATMTITNLALASANGNASNGSNQLYDTLTFSNMTLAVGSPALRGVVDAGRKQGSNNANVRGDVLAGANSVFNAYLTSIRLGCNDGTSGSGTGNLNLLAADSVAIDVSGSVELGSSTTGGTYYRAGDLRFANGTATVGGSLYLGYTTASENDSSSSSDPYKNGYLTLSNATCQVAAGGRVDMGGRRGNKNWQYNKACVTVTVNGAAAGLDILNSASTGLTLKFPNTLNNDGGNGRIYNQINVTLMDTMGASGWYWGVRWAGDHVAALRNLLDSENEWARLRIDTSDLSSTILSQHLAYLQILDPGTYGGMGIGDLTQADFIIYDDGNTYVGAHLSAGGSAPIIFALPATGIETDRAVLNGQLNTNGATAASVAVLWGPGGDQGPQLEGWAYTNNFGINTLPTPRSYDTNTIDTVSLSQNTIYSYRYFATNDTDGAWSGPESFMTKGAPAVSVSAATEVGWVSARLNGTVTAGEPAPDAHFCLKAGSDPGAGSATSAWDRVVSAGSQSGAFSSVVQGLTPETTYYCRTYVSNEMNDAWSTASVTIETGATPDLLKFEVNQVVSAPSAVLTFSNTTAVLARNVSDTYDFADLGSTPIDLDFCGHRIRTDNGTDVLIDMNGASIVANEGTGASPLSINTERTASAGNAGDVKIFGVGDITLGRIVTEAEVGIGNTKIYSGDVIIGEDAAGQRAGNVMIAGIDVRGDYDNPETGSGNVEIYSTGDVKIQRTTGTADDILCDWQVEWQGANQGGSVTIKHDGTFAARNIYTYAASDNYAIPGDVLLNGDALGDGPSGSLTVGRIYTGTGSGFSGGEMGDITISGYSQVVVTMELDTANSNGDYGDPAGEIYVRDIAGDITIADVDLYAADGRGGPYDEGDLWLHSIGGKISLGKLDMNRVRYAKFDAPGHSTIAETLSNFDTTTEGGTGTFDNPILTTQTRLQTPDDQYIFYDSDLNPGLGGLVYKIASLDGTKQAGGLLLPPEMLPAPGTVIFFQ